ncbi:MAG: S49 family peptidase [Pseudomonadota bacterium]
MKRYIPFMKQDPEVAVLRLDGLIAAGRGLNDNGIGPVLEKAFSGKRAAVALVINSPGGSPVQSALIGARIRRLAEEKEVPVYAFVEDVAASGGYWLAAAADEIFVDSASIVGSIGVISSNFGLQNAIAKIGVERRVYTAGKSKSMMDPFRAEKPEDVKRLKALLEDIHGIFIDHVQTRRGAKLTEDDRLFTGEIWVGQKGVDVGLADAVGHLVPVLKDRFGDKVRFRRFGQRRSILNRLGTRVLDDLGHSVEERAAYAQFGL